MSGRRIHTDLAGAQRRRDVLYIIFIYSLLPWHMIYFEKARKDYYLLKYSNIRLGLHAFFSFIQKSICIRKGKQALQNKVPSVVICTPLVGCWLLRKLTRIFLLPSAYVVAYVFNFFCGTDEGTQNIRSNISNPTNRFFCYLLLAFNPVNSLCTFLLMLVTIF